MSRWTRPAFICACCKPNAAWAKRYHPEFAAATQYLTDSCERREEAQREREQQRNAELERERREREQAELYAEEQRKAARRLRRFSFALVLISILALAAAGTAVGGFAFAKASERKAQVSESNAKADKAKAEAAQLKAQAAQLNAELLTKALQQNEALLTKKSDELAVSVKMANDAESRAEHEAATARAKEQDALDAKAVAVSAKELAEGNAQRGKLSQDILESLQRKNYDLARHSSGGLISSLKNTLKDPNHVLSKSDVQRLTVELGWAHAHEGSAWLGDQDVPNATTSYEAARNILERVWPKEARDPEESQPILYETYVGLGKAYQVLGLATSAAPQQVSPAHYFKDAETLFTDSLKYHQALLDKTNAELKDVEARGVIEGHFNLARLYRDMGQNEKAQQEFQAVEQFPLVQAGELAQARRELAEFYRDQNKYGEAVAAYKNLILQQEKIAIEEADSFKLSAPAEKIEDNFASSGQDIANSYNELADAYRGWADATTDRAKAKEMSDKADAAFGLSIALERFAVRLRRYLSASESKGPTDRDDLADTLGDAFLRFDKSHRAVLFYQYALDVRKSGSADDQRQVGKSYDKLGNLYRNLKDYDKAEQNYKDQVAFYQENARSGDYAKAVRDLAALYGDDPKAPPELAVTKYREALAIYHSLNDWPGEDVVLYRLTKLYEKRQQPDARLQALQERVTALKRYYDQLAAGTFKNLDEGPKLISEYLNAINVLGYTLAQGNDVAGAEAAYQRAWEMRKYVSTNIKFVKDTNTRTLYDAMLGEYQYMLTRQQKPELATAVREFRDTFNRADERNKVVQASAK